MLQSTVRRNLVALALALAAGVATYFILQGDPARSDSTQLTGVAARVASEFGVLASPQTTAVLADGATRTADVVDNGFSMAVGSSAKKIQWTSSDGVNHTAEGSQG